jgi:excisionase family DNA binding protein
LTTTMQTSLPTLPIQDAPIANSQVPLLHIDRPLSLEELASWLQIPRSTLYKYLGEGLRSVGVKAGREWRFRKDEVWDWLKTRQARKCLARVQKPTCVELAIPANLRLPLRRRQKHRYPNAPGNSGAVGQP